MDKGLVIRGPGRGEVIRRSQAAQSRAGHVVAIVIDGDKADTEVTEAAITNEIALYAPMPEVNQRDWARERRQDPLAVEITALGGSRPHGFWSHPHITTVEVRTFEYVPGKHLDVNTFETKSPGSVNVQAVYEALARRRAATRSYVLFYIPPGRAASLNEDVEDVATVARTHGIGVLTAQDPSDYDTWEELEEARRVPADPEKLNGFIAAQLSEGARSLISRRLR